MFINNRMTDTAQISASFDETLINLVKLNPQLYVKEKRIRPYESNKEKHELWKSIAVSLGVEPSVCILRWRQLLEKYRREILQSKQIINMPLTAADPLVEKMRFLDSYVNCSHKNSHEPNSGVLKPSVSSVSKSEEIFGGIHYEYLPEVMEAQSSTNTDAASKASPTMTYTSPAASPNPVLVRIKALLEGLDADNRSKAEKRILGYLCKCQLKALENESIDDIGF